MKKAAYLLLLILPLIILGIINTYSSVIARFIPIAVQSIAFDVTELSGEPGGNAQLSVSFTPARASNKGLTYYSSDEEVCTVDRDGRVSYLNYGFAEITAVSEDGRYEATCDVLLADKDDDPTVVKTVLFRYKDNIHGDYLFGNGNSISVSYKFFPKTAVSPLEFSVEGGEVRAVNGNTLSVTFDGVGAKRLTARTGENAVSGGYTFNVREGKNLVESNSFAEFTSWLSAKTDVYLLEDYKISSPVAYGGCTVYGNGRKIDHSGMPHYDDKNLDANTRAISLADGATLDGVRVVGKITAERLPYERVTNVGMSGDGVSVKNCVVENGKYNIATYGANKEFISSENINRGSAMLIDNTRMSGAAWASVQVNNAEESGYKKCGTELSVRDVHFSLTTVGFLMENGKSAQADGTKGFARLIVLPSATAGKSSITSDNWRNVDEGYSQAGISGFDYILDEIKSQHGDIVYKDEFNEYYVNCVILVMGGWRNLAEVGFTEGDITKNTLGYFERELNLIEAQQLGGKEKFRGYCVKSALYEE